MVRGVFVYGTLLSGFKGHGSLALGLTCLSRGCLRGFEMVHLSAGYPALFESDGGGLVFGELLEFESLDEALARFDVYEACDNVDPRSLYRRVKVQVELEGATAQAWCYVYAASGLAVALGQGALRVTSGDWRSFLREEGLRAYGG
jgi:gamma-glutamylcyclotransferase (GGCT)/AIG2-like uncharacterized protein YtfP